MNKRQFLAGQEELVLELKTVDLKVKWLQAERSFSSGNSMTVIV